MELRDNEFIAQAKSTLNEDQLKAFEGLIEFVNPIGDTLGIYKSNMITTAGYAGTGKTYMISKFISTLVDASIAMTAPTNKAVKVLVENKPDELGDVEYLTIHRLLALKMKWMYPKSGDKWKPYQKLVKVWGKDSQLNSYDILIVDEVSMLDDELFNLLVEQNKRTKIIFLGDSAQIPPVGKLDSIPLLEEGRKENKIGFYQLSKIMRQAEGSGILLTASSVRDNRFSQGEVVKNRKQVYDDMKFDNPDDIQDFMRDIKECFVSEKFTENPNYAKVIAWRNITVDAFNKIIRESIYKTKDLAYVMPGEKLIADTPIIKRTEFGSTILFNTSDEFEVLEYTEKTEDHFPNVESKSDALLENLLGETVVDPTQLRLTFRYLRARVRSVTDAEELIDILLPESLDSLKKAIGMAFKNKKFDLYEELSERFAQVKYNYAITAHKSQGSTYENVFVIEDDIDLNKKHIERNRIKYTAISRASKRLRLLSRRN